MEIPSWQKSYIFLHGYHKNIQPFSQKTIHGWYMGRELFQWVYTVNNPYWVIELIQWPSYGGFLKWWVSPTNPCVFLLKMISTWAVKWGYQTHHLRKHPYANNGSWSNNIAHLCSWQRRSWWWIPVVMLRSRFVEKKHAKPNLIAKPSHLAILRVNVPCLGWWQYVKWPFGKVYFVTSNYEITRSPWITWFTITFLFKKTRGVVTARIAL